jgi:hypothetical protein
VPVVARVAPIPEDESVACPLAAGLGHALGVTGRVGRVERWRLQPTWTVDGDEKRFAPSFIRTRVGAMRLEWELRRRFAHFDDFAVAIDKVPKEVAETSGPVMPSLDSPDWPKTTHCAASETHSLCGLLLSELSGWCTPDWFVSRRRRQTKFWVDCEDCRSAVTARGR